MSESLVAVVERHLQALAGGHPDRHIGRPGNIAAVDHVEAVFREHGWSVESAGFDALDCQTGPAGLTVDGQSFEVRPGPYTVPADLAGPLLPIDSATALEAADLAGAVVLLHGEIAADQLFPKSFDFIDTSEHRHIYELLERGRPAAAAVWVAGSTPTRSSRTATSTSPTATPPT